MRDLAITGQASRRWSLRQWFDVVHRWLGFTCGAVLVVAGLTGMLLAFYLEIENTFYPSMQTPNAHAIPASYEAVFHTLDALPKETRGFWNIQIPLAGGPITARYSVPVSTGIRMRMTTIDPVTLQVMRDTHWHQTFFTWIYDLHEQLLLGPTGAVIEGVVCLLMLLMLVTGLVNWAMARISLAAKLEFKRKAGAMRRLYDVHKLVGLVSMIVLLSSVGTAAMLSLPKQFRPLLSAFSPMKPLEPAVYSTPAAGLTRMPVDRAMALGKAAFPGSQLVWVKVPVAPTDPYDVRLREADDPMTRFTRTHVWLDQYSGRVLARYSPHLDGAGDIVLDWLIPLHEGTAFGMTGRIIILLAGFAPLTLFVTGFLRWKRKRALVRGVGQRRISRAHRH